MTTILIRSVFFIVSFFSLYCNAQELHSFKRDYAYVDFLFQNREFEEAHYFLDNYDRFNPQFLLVNKDSLSYLRGLTCYQLNKFDSSINYLKNVSNSSPLHTKSKYFEAFCQMEKKELDSAITLIDGVSFNKDDTIMKELRLFELASLSLLKRDYAGYKKHSCGFRKNNYLIFSEEEKLEHYYYKLEKNKRKRPWIAATLSAIIPGAGKIYSGQVGHGIAAFTTVAILGGITAESYLKSGKYDVQFWAAGTLFAVFYVGNIYGSYFSVKIKNEQFNNETNKSIMLDMRVPVSRIFN